MTKPISDFQKSFLAKAGMKVFTEKEFAEEIERAKDEIMTMAINAAKQAVLIERVLCAEVVDKMREEIKDIPDMPMSVDVTLEKCAEKIRSRTVTKEKKE